MATVHLIDNSTKEKLLSIDVEEVPRIGENLCISLPHGLSEEARKGWNNAYIDRLELLNTLELTVVSVLYEVPYAPSGARLRQHIYAYCNCAQHKDNCNA